MTLVKKNWAHSKNFKGLVELVVECGGREVSSHLITASRNATHLSPECISKLIKVMADYNKTPFQNGLKTGGKFTFYSHELNDNFN